MWQDLVEEIEIQRNCFLRGKNSQPNNYDLFMLSFTCFQLQMHQYLEWQQGCSASTIFKVEWQCYKIGWKETTRWKLPKMYLCDDNCFICWIYQDVITSSDVGRERNVVHSLCNCRDCLNPDPTPRRLVVLVNEHLRKGSASRTETLKFIILADAQRRSSNWWMFWSANLNLSLRCLNVDE